MRVAKPATPLQIVKYGHIAMLIRSKLAEKQWSIPDFHEKLGLPRTSATAYHWLNCMGAPGNTLAAKVAKLLGVPLAELAARDPGDNQLPVVLAAPGYPTVGPSKPAVRSLPPAGDVLSFSVDSDGLARLRLDVRLPLAQAAPLLRVLLDAGIVMGGDHVDAE
jgi:hypothetical protein